MTSSARGTGQSGSTLLVFPALTLVVFTLAAIAVDLSLLHLRQRQLVVTVDQAAEDAAGAIDRQVLRTDGRTVLDRDVAVDIARTHLRASSISSDLVGPVEVRIRPDGVTIEVKAAARVPRVFTGALPNVTADDQVHAIGVGRLVRLDHP